MKNSQKVIAVLLAAGCSSRMVGKDKIWEKVCGKPVIEYSLDLFEHSKLVDDLIVVTSKKNKLVTERFISENSFTVRSIVVGGNRRQDSVMAALNVISNFVDKPEYIIVHDAARPLVDNSMIEKGLALVKQVGAAIPVIPIKDTLKQVSNQLVVKTLDRNQIVAAQTPQFFSYSSLNAANDYFESDMTDDSIFIELAGGMVGVFDGEEKNIKVTQPLDLMLAEILLTENVFGTVTKEWSHGTGYDSHKLAKGGPLKLGGLTMDWTQHLEGHSDGDVLLHAIASSILGSAGLGDLGGRFPSSDPNYKDYDSALFLTESSGLIGDLGWEIIHIDATIIAQQPRLSSYISPIEKRIKSLLKSKNPSLSVNVKVTSTDGLGTIGKGEGIASQSIVTVRQQK
ncbi:2-C-methyl-D-erythritol 4-phosphate cytidylyltransferase [Dehalococcoidia bacterium]|nr:2-C-methyl-D-erythritol 4-phosphate cytidylyltransferase [Dehalococcoidia bacterium]